MADPRRVCVGRADRSFCDASHHTHNLDLSKPSLWPLARLRQQQEQEEQHDGGFMEEARLISVEVGGKSTATVVTAPQRDTDGSLRGSLGRRGLEERNPRLAATVLLW